MCLEGMTEGWVGVDDTDGGGETVPYVGAGHWEGTPSELRPVSFDGSGSSSGGAKLAYIRVGRSKHDKVREVRQVSTVESLMHDSKILKVTRYLTGSQCSFCSTVVMCDLRRSLSVSQAARILNDN